MKEDRGEDRGGAVREPRATSIRPATAKDAQLLAELGERTFRETFDEFNRPEDMAAFLAATYTRERQASELANPQLRYFIGELGHQGVGFALLRRGTTDSAVHGDNPIELARIYVVKAAIGSGMGAALMQTCLVEARRLGHRTLWLGVWEQNERALAFYRRWGFVDVGSHIFHVGSDPQVDRVMTRGL